MVLFPVLDSLPPDNPFTPAVQLIGRLIALAFVVMSLFFLLDVVKLYLLVRYIRKASVVNAENHDLLAFVRLYVEMQKSQASTAASQVTRATSQVVGAVTQKVDEVKSAVQAVPDRIMNRIREEKKDGTSDSKTDTPRPDLPPETPARKEGES